MNRLEILHINNFRSCIDTQVDFHENLTALIGANGVGKTNILSAITLFAKVTQRAGRMRMNNHLEESPQSIVETRLNIDGKVIHVKSIFYMGISESSEDIIYVDTSYSKNRKKWVSIDNSFYEYSEYLEQISYNSSLKKLLGGTSKDDFNLKRAIVTYLANISYYSATQFSNPSLCPVSLELDKQRPLLGHRYSNKHEKFIRELYQSKDDSTFSKFLSIVGKGGLGLIDTIRFKDYSLPNNSIRVLAGGIVKNITRDKKIVIPSVEIDGLKLSFNQLSEGTFKSLALIFYIINDKNDLLIIEEPEVCVHHGLLTSLIELIKRQSRKKQIVISTHSDYVLDMLKPENIILVDKKKTSGTVANQLEKVMYEDEYRYLKQYLNTTGNLGEYWKESGFDND